VVADTHPALRARIRHGGAHGGDEFVVILPDSMIRNIERHRAEIIANWRRHSCWREKAFISASIGITRSRLTDA